MKHACIRNDPRGQQLLTGYCAGTLDPAVAAGIENHIRECAPCRELVEAQRSVWDMLDAWKPSEVSADFDARLYARIAEEQAVPAWQQPLWKRWIGRIVRPAVPYAWWKPVASVGLAAGIVSVALMLHPADRNAPPVSEAAPVVTASTLPDGVDLQQVQQALDDLEVLTPPSQSSASPL